MIEIRPLTTLISADLEGIGSSYTSTMKYVVEVKSSNDDVSFNLKLAHLENPYVKKFDLFDTERFDALLRYNCSFGAYIDDLLIGLAIAEIHSWNNTLWIHEFHLAEGYRNQGIGRRLMQEVSQKARDEKLRAIVCETQNTNTSAIGFYRSLGFRIEGIDISHYSNKDYPDGEIAIFMKLRLHE